MQMHLHPTRREALTASDTALTRWSLETNPATLLSCAEITLPVQPRNQGEDQEGCEALVPRHLAAMLRVAAALVGVAEAEDAAQEALVRSWQAWPTLRDVSAQRPWLLRMTVNVCRDWCRGRFGTRRRLVEPLEADGSEETLAPVESKRSLW